MSLQSQAEPRVAEDAAENRLEEFGEFEFPDESHVIRGYD